MAKNKSQDKGSIKSGNVIISVGNLRKPTRAAMNRAFELYSMGNKRDKVEQILREEFPDVSDFTDMLAHVENVGLESWTEVKSKPLNSGKNMLITSAMADETTEQLFEYLKHEFGSVEAILEQDSDVLKDILLSHAYEFDLDEEGIDYRLDSLLKFIQRGIFSSSPVLYTSGGYSMAKNKSQGKTTINSGTSLAEDYNSDPMTQKVLAKALGLFYKGSSRDEVEMVLRQDFPGDFDFTDILNYVESELLSSSARRDSFNLKNTIKSAKSAYYFKGIDVGDLALEFFSFEDNREKDFRGGSYFDLGDDDLFEHAVTWLSEVKDLGDMEDPAVEKAAWRMLGWIDANRDSISSSVLRGSKPNLKDTIKSAKEMKLQLFDTGAFKLDLSQEKDNSLLCSTVKGSCDVGAVLSVASRDGYTFQDLSQGVDLSNSPLFTEYKDLLVSTAVLKPDTLQTVKRMIASGVVSGKELFQELSQWGLDNPGQVFQSMQVLGADLASGDSVKSVGRPIKSGLPVKSVRRPITMSFCSGISDIITEAVYAASHDGLTPETLYGIVNIVAQNKGINPMRVFFDLQDGLNERGVPKLSETEFAPSDVPNETAQDFVRCLRGNKMGGWESLPNSALDNPSAKNWRREESDRLERNRQINMDREEMAPYLDEAASSVKPRGSQGF